MCGVCACLFNLCFYEYEHLYMLVAISNSFLLFDVCDWLEPFVMDVCQNKTFSNAHIAWFPYSTNRKPWSFSTLIPHCCHEYIFRDPQAPKNIFYPPK